MEETYQVILVITNNNNNLSEAKETLICLSIIWNNHSQIFPTRLMAHNNFNRMGDQCRFMDHQLILVDRSHFHQFQNQLIHNNRFRRMHPVLLLKFNHKMVLQIIQMFHNQIYKMKNSIKTQNTLKMNL
jgi:hypothetical protein